MARLSFFRYLVTVLRGRMGDPRGAVRMALEDTMPGSLWHVEHLQRDHELIVVCTSNDPVHHPFDETLTEQRAKIYAVIAFGRLAPPRHKPITYVVNVAYRDTQQPRWEKWVCIDSTGRGLVGCTGFLAGDWPRAVSGYGDKEFSAQGELADMGLKVSLSSP